MLTRFLLESKSSKLPQRNNHQNISCLLDNLLSGYDNSIRPDFGGPPAIVEVDIMVRSMGPISEVDMVIKEVFSINAVELSEKLTIKAGCPMNLEDFPMDIQRCPLKFGSFGYTSRDVIYRWNKARQVAIAEDMKLSQFDLIATPAANHTDNLLSSAAQSGVRSIFHSPTHLSKTQLHSVLVPIHLDNRHR
ncbi:hypothetical protein NQ317_018116 [Molorchus minor]|uniref:Neurotransmitter-gated ion-channel ligand-binding domain-containing protein n=1 Tax=Molorchus minor TaxID=1323400 RepID=A0ABQ9JDB2_9CUCU|nr:hypothetical protein NQ317_018116 [Molorchus minor]